MNLLDPLGIIRNPLRPSGAGSPSTGLSSSVGGGLVKPVRKPQVPAYAQQFNDEADSYDQMGDMFSSGQPSAPILTGGQNKYQEWTQSALNEKQRQQNRQDFAASTTGSDYRRATGRINAGIGTGDKAQRDNTGRVVGYGSVDRGLSDKQSGIDFVATFPRSQTPELLARPAGTPPELIARPINDWRKTQEETTKPDNAWGKKYDPLRPGSQIFT